MIKLQELFDELQSWQKNTFPSSIATAKLHHLSKEVVELIEELEKEEVDVQAITHEFADCFLLLFGAWTICGFNAKQMVEVINEKLEINKNRKWGVPDENGVVLHIKD